MIGIIHSSCMDEMDIDFHTNTNNQIVVLSFPTPGDSIHVYVGETSPLSTNQKLVEKNISNAIVTLSNQYGAKIKLKNTDQINPSIYVASQNDFLIESGEEYTLEVVVPNKMPLLAKTVLPTEKARWKTLQTAANRNGGHVLNGSWDPVLSPNLQYGYSVVTFNKGDFINFLGGNTGIKLLSEAYVINRNFFLESNSQIALITKDKNLDEFSKMNEVMLELNRPRKDEGFFSLITMFKGNLSHKSNITNGIGVFGSYLVETQPLF